MAPTDPSAPAPAPRRRRARLLSLLLTVTLVATGAWFLLRRRAPALPAYADEARPGPSTTARPAPVEPTAPAPAAATSAAPGPTGPGPEVVAPDASEPVASEPREADASGAATASESLQRVSGIGRRSADALVAAGIDSLERLAGTDDATLVAALEAAGLRRSPTLSAWASQARRLTRA